MKQKPRLVYLSGFMGSGKTSVGKILSIKLNIPLFDTDKILTQKTGFTIEQLFKKFGESHFRILESKVISSIKGPAVVSLGGGAILSANNRQRFQKGLWFYLKTSPAIIEKRLINDTSRPLLKKNNKRQIIEDLIRQRQPYYNLAHFCINTDNSNPPQVAQKIMGHLRKQHEKN